MSGGPNARMNWYDGWRTITVTYERADKTVYISKTGYGADYASALNDADEQLRPGKWRRLTISQPSGIVADIRNAGRPRGNLKAKRPGEGEIVTILPPRVRKPHGTELSDE